MKYPQKYFRQSIIGYMGNKFNKLIIFFSLVASLVYVGNMDDVHETSAVTVLEESVVSRCLNQLFYGPTGWASFMYNTYKRKSNENHRVALSYRIY
jgi:hypothetical protein